MDRNTILIVDDSEIDRMILNEILADDFDIIIKENGYSALEYMMEKKNTIECLLLDIKMPVLDGFDVLRLMRESKVEIPTFLCTVEATKQNVEKASEFRIQGFIAKPYKPDVVLDKMKKFFGIPDEEPVEVLPTTAQKYKLDEEQTLATDTYILRLKSIYDSFMSNMGISDSKFRRVSNVFAILLRRYNEISDDKLKEEHINIASRAAYFYDIGMMVLPAELQKVSNEEISGSFNHTVLGAKLICLNESPHVEFFVNCCSDICMSHHERWDGSGYPHRLTGEDIKIMPLITSLTIEFDRIFTRRTEFDEKNFDFTMREMKILHYYYGEVLEGVMNDCKSSIIKYYIRNCRPAEKN